MVQAGITAAVTRAQSWCVRGRCRRQWRLSRAGHSYSSCKGKDAQGYGRVETEVQAETLTAALVAQSCRALALAVATNGGRGSRGSGGSKLR